MDDAPKRILFVCTGNICRSAMAEHLLRHRSAARGLGLEVRSAGTAAESWYEMPEHARKLLAEEGLAAFEHKARLLTREHLKWADLVLVMTHGHLDLVLDAFPEFTRKTALLREAAGFGPQDVADPMGKDYATFSSCLGVIRESLDALERGGFRPATP